MGMERSWNGWNTPCGVLPDRTGRRGRLTAAWLTAVWLLAAVAFAGGPDGRGAVHRLGVVGFYNPRLMYAKYQRLVDYLSAATEQEWELAVTLHYDETVRALCAGEIDVAYLGPFTALRAHAACGAEPVVRLQTGGRATYRSLILVRRDGPVHRLEDLRGRVFAFGSPLSTSSHLVPRLMLEEAGLRPGTDVACRYFGHHDRAARAVLLGEADACGVRDIVGERFRERGLRVLARSRPLPNFPFVLAPGSPEAVREALVEALVRRPARDRALRSRMREWDVELAGGFALASENDYRPIMDLVERVFGRDGLTAPPEALVCGGGG